MKLNLKTLGKVLAFIIFFALIWVGVKVNRDKRIAFENLNMSMENLSTSTPSRIANAVVTLPDGNIIVGLKDNKAEYTSEDKKFRGSVSIKEENIETKFIPGIFETKSTARLDAVVPMSVTGDSYDGSLYIVLFQDRGYTALEKSYARLGGLDVKINSITMLPQDGIAMNQEYRVSIKYTQSSQDKEVIIPVMDGRFDPDGAITK